jgi:hypothetical protein
MGSMSHDDTGHAIYLKNGLKLHFLRIKPVHDTQGFSSMQHLQSSRQSYTMANIALHIISIAPHGKTTFFKQILKGGIFIYSIKRMPLSIMKTLFPFLD